MAGKHQYKVLTNALGREHLLEHGVNNGVDWNEDSHEGVNWMRFSRALVTHLDQGKQFDVDHVDPNILNKMAQHYMNLRELHKQTMIPHVRAAMSRLRSQDVSTHKGDMEYLHDAYDHLDKHGGHDWAEKVRTLHHLNTKIDEIQGKLERRGYIQKQ